MGTLFERASASPEDATRANQPRVDRLLRTGLENMPTSPVRSGYPDLTVHRASTPIWTPPRTARRPRRQGGGRRSGMEYDERCLSENHLSEVGDHCSATEKNADAAERACASSSFSVPQMIRRDLRRHRHRHDQQGRHLRHPRQALRRRHGQTPEHAGRWFLRRRMEV